MEATLLHELVTIAAAHAPDATALTHGGRSIDYGTFGQSVIDIASSLRMLDLTRGGRVAVYLDKRLEAVVAMFGAAAAGGVFVPLNPILKPLQVQYVLRDCAAQVLVTSSDRLALLEHVLQDCNDLRHVLVVDADTAEPMPARPYATHLWKDLQGAAATGHRVIDVDMAAILYTSGSTGQPKGVVLSHRNLVAGAKSVASYLENHSRDVLLAVLPLSFDAGFSQLTTAFHAGARVVLLNYLLPKDVLNALIRERVTGITAVPPLYLQLTQLPWPEDVDTHLRYFANTGGRMPLETLRALRSRLPKSKPYLMYGLTEAFRSTFLPPDEVDRRPDSIGKAIPNAEILVLREDGTECGADEPGELVHRGALVGMGYWNDAEKTDERYRPLPGREGGLKLPEVAVFSGDLVRKDSEGFLYFIGRRDDMIKTSGYRVSPTEIEEVLYETQLVGEAAAFGVAHPMLGQSIVVIVTPKGDGTVDTAALLAACRERLPAYMVPGKVDVRSGPLPRNPNGKIDRKQLRLEFEGAFNAVEST
jgi:acyl-CoA ligase (AMP-forming) (exosortase A-associated)